MSHLRLTFRARLEAEFSEHSQHRGVLGQDIRDQLIQSCVARQVSQMPHEGRSDPLSLIRIHHDKGYFRLTGLDNDIASTSDDRGPSIFIDLCDERDMIVEINVHKKSDFSFCETALRYEKASLHRLRAGAANRREHVLLILRSKGAYFNRAPVAK